MIRYKSNYSFSNNNGFFLYNSNCNELFQVPQSVYKMIQALSDGKKKSDIYSICKNELEKSEIDEAINNLDELNNKVDDIEDYSLGNVNILNLLVVQECNFRCKYCYAEDGQYKKRGIMDLDTGKKAVDFLFNSCGEDNDLSIIFFGGEPLLNFPLIKKVVNYANNKALEYKKNIGYSITTNGSLIDEEIKQYFIDNKFTVQISIDGDRETTNKNRILPNGSGAYDSIVQKTSTLTDKMPIMARATITDSGLNIPSNFEHLYSLGCVHVAMEPAFNMISKENIETLLQSEKELFMNFKEYLLKKDYKKCISVGNVMKLLKKIESSFSQSRYCGAGNRYIAADIEGNLYPCHRFVSEKNFCMGNITEGITHTYKFNDNIVECKDCICKSICAGGCPYDNYLSTESVNIPCDVHCRIMKSVTPIALDIFTYLTEEEKKLLKLK